MEEAKAAQERAAKSRLEILQEARGEPCTCKQASRWHASATELLEHNGISCKSFARAVKELLCKGRGKYRNIMLTGPANRPNRLTRCCTQFKSRGVKILCVLHLH